MVEGLKERLGGVTLGFSREIQLRECVRFGAVGLAFTRNNSFDKNWLESVDPLVLVCTKVCDVFRLFFRKVCVMEEGVASPPCPSPKWSDCLPLLA